MSRRRRTQSGSTVGGRKHVIAPVCFLQIRTVLKDYGGLGLEPSRVWRPAAPENYTFERLKGTRPCLSFCNKTNLPFGLERSLFPALFDHKNETEFGMKKYQSD